MRRTRGKKAERNPSVSHLPRIAQSTSKVSVNDEGEISQDWRSVVRRFVAWQALGNALVAVARVQGRNAIRLIVNHDWWCDCGFRNSCRQ